MTISYIIPSINRMSLKQTIDSIEMRAGDEICIEFDLPPTGWWGNIQRNRAIERAHGEYLAFIDDDDHYVKGHRQIFDKAITDNPDKPNLFRIKYPNGTILWKTKKLEPGNVSTQMILIPNDPTMFSRWYERPNMADVMFVKSWKWEEIIWRPEITCLMGHNPK